MTTELQVRNQGRSPEPSFQSPRLPHDTFVLWLVGEALGMAYDHLQNCLEAGASLRITLLLSHTHLKTNSPPEILIKGLDVYGVRVTSC